MKGDKYKAYAGIALIIATFLLISYLINRNTSIIQGYILSSRWSMLIYFLLIVAEIVVAPISLIPVIPLASALWGPIISFVITILGWTLGSIIAFILARKLGTPILEKLVSMKEIKRYHRFIPEKNLLSWVIITRIFIPIDIMSYAIAIFTKIDVKKFALGTFIGFIPITLILSFFGGIPSEAKIVLIVIGIILILLMSIFDKRLKQIFKRFFKNEKES